MFQSVISLNFLGRNLNEDREIIIIAAEMRMTVLFTKFYNFGQHFRFCHGVCFFSTSFSNNPFK